MTDSPAETKKGTDSSSDPKIPKQRFDEKNQEAKDLRTQLETAQRERDQLLERAKAIEAEKQLYPEAISQLIREAIEPMRKEIEATKQKAKLSVQYGLRSDEQVAAVTGYLDKGLSEQEAIILAQASNPKLFAQQNQNSPGHIGMLPPGVSPGVRAPRQEEEDHLAKFRALDAEGKYQEADIHSQAAFAKQIQALRNRR